LQSVSNSGSVENGGKEMGFEIRMVPPHWQWGAPNTQPMYDRRFEDVVKEWKEGFLAWEAGTKFRPENLREDGSTMEYWEAERNPPGDRAYYRPWKDEEATWFQVWETVSEGTPVTPAFHSRGELAEFLSKFGTAWDDGPWGWDRATAFCKEGEGWAPSGLINMGTGEVVKSRDFALYMEQQKEKT
jgi:hypothetical protein